MTLKKPGRNIPPVQRLKPWMSVAIRMETYAKLREMRWSVGIRTLRNNLGGLAPSFA